MTDTLDSNWFTDARFGLFVHYGLYSLLERGEWVLNREKIPLQEYRQLASRFKAERFNADALCDLAAEAGMRYIIFTTMHHDGFCLYDTKLTDFNSVAACGRDLVDEIVRAARKRGLRICLYHSLNHWSAQPDAVAALENKSARETFIAKTRERVRELVTRYNPIDVLWYDGWWPFDAKGWKAAEMNAMVRSIQPHIIFNGRNGLAGDFATPENHLGAPSPWRPWEACMTMNQSWGYHGGDHAWKSPAQIVDMLATVASRKGNLVLNVGPRGDGSVPDESVTILKTLGAWMKRCGESVFDTDMFTFDLRERGDHCADWSGHGPFTAKGNAFYLLAQRWPGSTLTICGLECTVRNVVLLGSDRKIAWKQSGDKVVLTSLPSDPPDPVCPVFRFDCDRKPVMYLCGGMRTPNVPHPHYDPCPSDIAHPG